LIRGLVEGAQLGEAIAFVIGPDELKQVGLEGIAWDLLVRLAGGEPGLTYLIGYEPDLPSIPPPADLALLAESLPFGKG
jgi:hypothetical protein